MMQPYSPPCATCICYAVTESIAAIAPINLIDGASGLGASATVSETDIRIEIKL